MYCLCVTVYLLLPPSVNAIAFNKYFSYIKNIGHIVVDISDRCHF
jgi:hypothetical protein